MSKLLFPRVRVREGENERATEREREKGRKKERKENPFLMSSFSQSLLFDAAPFLLDFVIRDGSAQFSPSSRALTTLVAVGRSAPSFSPRPFSSPLSSS